MTTTDTYPEHYAHPLVTWRATLLGAAVAFVIAIMLNVLGVALGVAALAAGQTASASDAGIASVAWVAVANLIALGIGAWVAARSTPNPDYHSGALQGVAVWAVTTLAVLFLATSSISGAAGSLLRTAGAASSGAVAQSDPASARDQAQDAAADASAALQRNAGAIREAAGDAAGATAAGAFGLFAAMLLGLIAAVIGARLGAKHPQWANRPRYTVVDHRTRDVA